MRGGLPGSGVRELGLDDRGADAPPEVQVPERETRERAAGRLGRGEREGGGDVRATSETPAPAT